MSTIIVGNTASVILDANYQTAGTYVTGVVGTSPISASGTTAITVTIDQAAITGATAATNAQVVRFYVKNTTGTTIPKGSAVYVSGATGDNALISLASATSDPTSSKTLGITAESIANDAFGYVIEAGYLTDIDTSSTTAGAAVWLGNTPGSIVFVTPPAEPSHAVYLGVVVRVQAINGSILVKVQNGYELDELHDVFVGGVSTALPLVYSSTSSGWVAQALTSVGIADNAIVAAKINAGAVDSAALADNAVVAAKINAGAVGSAAISDNAVVAAKIAAGSVGTSKIDSGSATSGSILTSNGSSGASFQPALEGWVDLWYDISGAISGTSIGVPEISSPYKYNMINQGTNTAVVKISGTWDTSMIPSETISLSSISSVDRLMVPGAVTWSAITSGFVSTNRNLLSIDYDGSKFALCGVAGVIYTSIDGSAWTSRTSGTASQLNSIAYGDSIWLAVGSSGVVTRSIDGESWTVQTSPNTAVTNNQVSYGDGVWVIVSNGGNLYTSIDGTSWTSRTSSFGATNILSVGYGLGKWYAGGESNKFSSSIDGSSWTIQTSLVTSSTAKYFDIAFGDGIMMVGVETVVSLESYHTFYYSPDGSTWTSTFSTGPNVSVSKSFYGSGVWVILRRTTTGTINTSFDLTTWTVRGSSVVPNSGVYGNGSYVISCNSNSVQRSTTNVAKMSFTKINQSSITGTV
jgi:hypothetical protein